MSKVNLDTSDIDLSCFDEGQKEVVLQLVKRAADAAVETALESKDDDPTLAEFKDMEPKYRRLAVEDRRKVQRLKSLWKNNGQVEGLKDRVTYKEMVAADRKWHQKIASEASDAGFASTDHPIMIARVISEIVKESVEPNIVLTPMMQRVNFSHGTSLTFPAMGAIAAADIPEGGEYPERSLDFAGQTVATIGKSGLAVKVTEELIRYSLYDVMSMHFNAAGRALIRWKEQKVADLIIANAGGANTIIDNTRADFKSSTGRSADGTYNGTLTLDDLFRAYADMVNRGFQPNTLIMNPFAWEIFADEGIARAFGFINGMAMWQAVQGSVASVPQWAGGGGNNLLNNTQVTDPQQLSTTFTNVPSIFPTPFSIVVSPYMPYSATNGTTDMILCDRSELGILVVDEEVTTDEWTDPSVDIMKVKFRERYGLGTMNNGAGSGILKGIRVNVRSFDFSRLLQGPQINVPATQPLTGDEGFSGGTPVGAP
jgi:hypothetical protein